MQTRTMLERRRCRRHCRARGRRQLQIMHSKDKPCVCGEHAKARTRRVPKTAQNVREKNSARLRDPSEKHRCSGKGHVDTRTQLHTRIYTALAAIHPSKTDEGRERGVNAKSRRRVEEQRLQREEKRGNKQAQGNEKEKAGNGVGMRWLPNALTWWVAAFVRVMSSSITVFPHGDLDLRRRKKER